ncbi:hypothetical protein F444_22015 [Phytophthora nicotianae P1976]|uniref:RxLR effector protein n=1 Tax=Phytophthora nicotianae P1976 TaxID=1317066 RepID=A0A080YZ84_PHYNI|nr:hypothetical protein F444_22015 [Phytophthora nicotianae P1976]
MRLAYFFVLGIAGTLHDSSSAFPATIANAKAMIDNEAPPNNFDPIQMDGYRLLRRVDNDEQEIEEQRTFSLGDVLKKLNPVKAVKKAKEKVQDATDKITDPNWKDLVVHFAVKGDDKG